MPNPKGSNAGAKGVKGRSGRKSAYKENQIAQKIISAFEEGVDVKKLEQLLKDVKSGKVKKLKLTDLVLAKAVKGEPILLNLLNKLLPDKLEHSGSVKSGPTEIRIVKPK